MVETAEVDSERATILSISHLKTALVSGQPVGKKYEINNQQVDMPC